MEMWNHSLLLANVYSGLLIDYQCSSPASICNSWIHGIDLMFLSWSWWSCVRDVFARRNVQTESFHPCWAATPSASPCSLKLVSESFAECIYGPKNFLNNAATWNQHSASREEREGRMVQIGTPDGPEFPQRLTRGRVWWTGRRLEDRDE